MTERKDGWQLENINIHYLMETRILLRLNNISQLIYSEFSFILSCTFPKGLNNIPLRYKNTQVHTILQPHAWKY